MGDDGFIIFWTQIGHFQGEHRGGFESPPPTRKRIFSTPPGIGLILLHQVEYYVYKGIINTRL